MNKKTTLINNIINRVAFPTSPLGHWTADSGFMKLIAKGLQNISFSTLGNIDVMLMSLFAGHDRKIADLKESSFNADQLIEWSTSVNGYEFADQIYDRSEDDFDNDGYSAGKFMHMQRDFMGWASQLDDDHRVKLTKAISINQ